MPSPEAPSQRTPQADVAPPPAPPADHVTGLATRGSLEAFLPGALQTPPLAALICDVVGLKAVNSGRGFLAGDAVLREAAGRLRATATTATLVARLGGDELVATFTGPSAASNAQAAAEALAAATDAPAIRVGWTTARPDDTPATLVERLYAAMWPER